MIDFQPPSSDAALDWALAYAAAGMAVFPLKADGSPLTERGFKQASTDAEQIQRWWKRWPHAEIGWAVPAGVVVVDLDEKNGKRGLGSRRKRSKPLSLSRHRAGDISFLTIWETHIRTKPGYSGRALISAARGWATSS